VTHGSIEQEKERLRIGGDTNRIINYNSRQLSGLNNIKKL